MNRTRTHRNVARQRTRIKYLAAELDEPVPICIECVNRRHGDDERGIELIALVQWHPDLKRAHWTHAS